MSKWTTIFACAFTFFAGTRLMSQTIIWGGPDDPNSTFDGGLNGWTTVGFSCGENSNGDLTDASNAIWEYKANANPSGGAYAIEKQLLSPSASNGAVIFNSDRLDNNGTQGSNMTGPCPSPHKGYLVSPIIDLRGEHNVILMFYQFFRNFQARTTIEVTGDGGQTWTEYEINQEIKINTYTPTDSRKLIDISETAADKEEVRIRFVFEGEYYFWLIDDVVLISNLPQNSLGMDRHFYPVSNLFIPQAVASGEKFSFSARISNEGGNTVTDAFLKAQIVNAADSTIEWEDSIALDPIPIGTYGLVVSFPDDITYTPTNLEPGQYFIRYKLYQPGAEDYLPTDNVRQSAFNITYNNEFWQSGELRRYSRPCFDLNCEILAPWGWGSFFRVPAETVEDFKLSDVVVSVEGENTAADLNGKEIKFSILGIINENDFLYSTGPNDDSNYLAAAGKMAISSANNRQQISIGIYDLDDYLFKFIKGVKYFAYLSMPDGIKMGYDNQFLNYPVSLSDDHVVLSSRLFFDGFFQSTFRNAMPFIKFNLLTTTFDNIPLPDYALTLFPNPAGNYTTVDLKLDLTSNITITLADISGKVIHFQNFSAVQHMQHTLDTSKLQNGAYIVRVATESGTSTKKLMIAK